MMVCISWIYLLFSLKICLSVLSYDEGTSSWNSIVWIVEGMAGIHVLSNPSTTASSNYYLPYQTLFLGSNLSVIDNLHYIYVNFPVEGWLALASLGLPTKRVIATILPKPSLRKTVLERWSLREKCLNSFPRYSSVAFEGGKIRGMFNPIKTVESAGQCCEECLKHSLCSHWTYHSDKSCSILSFSETEIPNKKAIPGTISGSIRAEDLRNRDADRDKSKRNHAAVQSLLSPANDCIRDKIDPVLNHSSLSPLRKIPIYSFIDHHRLLAPSPFHLQTQPVIGSWDEQWPIGTGTIGAFVGGNIHYEVNPISINNFFLLKPSKHHLTAQSLQYRNAKREYLAGNFRKAEKLLSQFSKYHELGMFQYLFDFTTIFSKHPLRFLPSSSSAKKTCRSDNRKGRVECILLHLLQQPSKGGSTSWLKGTFQPFTQILHSQSQLDLSSGIVQSSYIARNVLKMKKDNFSSLVADILSTARGDEDISDAIEHQDQFHYREWFASSIDEAIVGQYRCSEIRKTQEPETKVGCLNMALELSQNIPPRNSGVPNQIVKTFRGIDFLSQNQLAHHHLNDDPFISSLIDQSFIIHFQLQSSNHSIVPTTSAWIVLLCDNHQDFTFQENQFSDRHSQQQHMLFICNAAKELRFMIVIEKVDNLGLSLQELWQKNLQESQHIVERSKARLIRLLKKGFQAIRRDHIKDIQTNMKSMSFEYSLGDQSIALNYCPHSFSNLPRFQSFGKSFPSPFAQRKVQFIDLQIMTQLYQYGRYLMLSSGRKSITNLQGLWSEGIRSAWNGDYHININMQMNYWSIFQTGMKDSYYPLLEFLHRLVEKGSVTAKYMYNIAQINASSPSSASGPLSSSAQSLKYADILPWVSHGFTDSTLHSFPNGGLEWSLCVTCGAWLATHLHDLFLYENIDEIDSEIISKKILPIYRGAIVFFLQYLFKSRKGPTIHSGPTTSPESTYVWLLHNPSPEIHKEIPTSLSLSPAIDISVLRQISNQFNQLIELLSSKKDKEHLVSPRDFRLGEEFENTVSHFPNAAIPKVVNGFASLKSLRALIKEYPDDYLTLDQLRPTDEKGNVLVRTAPRDTNEIIVHNFEDIDYGHRHFSSLHWLFPNPHYPFLREAPIRQEGENDGNIYSAALRTLHTKYEHSGGHTEWSSMWMICLLSRLNNYEQDQSSYQPTSTTTTATSSIETRKNDDLILELFQRFFSRYLSNNFLTLHPKLQIIKRVRSFGLAIANSSITALSSATSTDHTTASYLAETSSSRRLKKKTNTDRFNRSNNNKKKKKNDHGERASKQQSSQLRKGSTAAALSKEPSHSDLALVKKAMEAANQEIRCKTCYGEPFIPARPHIAAEIALSYFKNQQGYIELIDLENEIHQHVDDSLNSLISELNKERGFEDSNQAVFQIDGNFGFLTAVNELLVQSFLPNIIHLFPIPTIFLFHAPHLTPLRGRLEGLQLPGNSRIVRMEWQTSLSSSSSSSSSPSSSEGKVKLLIMEVDLSHFWWRKGSVKEKGEEKRYGFYRLNIPLKEIAEISILSPSALQVIRDPQQQRQEYQRSFGSVNSDQIDFCAIDEVNMSLMTDPSSSSSSSSSRDYYSTISQGKYEIMIQTHINKRDHVEIGNKRISDFLINVFGFLPPSFEE